MKPVHAARGLSSNLTKYFDAWLCHKRNFTFAGFSSNLNKYFEAWLCHKRNVTFAGFSSNLTKYFEAWLCHKRNVTFAGFSSNLTKYFEACLFYHLCTCSYPSFPSFLMLCWLIIMPVIFAERLRGLV